MFPEPMTVFVVLHLHVLPGDVEDIKMIGVYTTEALALAAIDRLQLQPGFQDYPRIVEATADADPNGFQVCEYRLDEDHWTEGFVTVN